MQKTEGEKLSDKTKAPAHRNGTQVLELEFFIRTKLAPKHELVTQL